MESDEIRFESIKEDRGWYFVEYSPPILKFPFAVLHLTVIEATEAATVAAAIEAEAKTWLARYPVPLMATAFAADGDVISLGSVRPINHLMAWLDLPDTTPILRWERVADGDLPEVALDRDFLEDVFSNVPSRTGREIQAEAKKHVARRKAGWWLVFFWAVVVPLGVAILEWWSDWLGIVVLAYAFFKAAMAALRFTGHMPKSARLREQEATELRMRHHHYHCERNPDGFERLKAENVRRHEIERTRAEVAVLREGSRSPPSH